MPATAPTGRASNPGPVPRTGAQGVDQRPALRAQLGVGDGHLEGGRQHAVGRRGPEQLRHLRGRGQSPASGGRRALEPVRHALDGRALDLVEGRVDRGPLGQRSTLPPSLTLVGHHPDEEQGAGAMHTGCRAN
jgi:hypothetical protein